MPAASTSERPGAGTIAVTALAVVATAGWLLERRRRLGKAAAEPAATVPDAQPSGPAPEGFELAVIQEPAARPLIGHRAKKKAINLLMGFRTVAGGCALLAGIACIVFWSIGLSDTTGADTDLNLGLLGLALVAWAAFWCAGYIANELHRAAFNRAHPKFSD